MHYLAIPHQLVQIAALYAEKEAGFGGCVDVLDVKQGGGAYGVELCYDVLCVVLVAHGSFLLSYLGEFGYGALVFPVGVEEAINYEGHERYELGSEEYRDVSDCAGVVVRYAEEAGECYCSEGREDPVAVVGDDCFHFFSFLWVEHGGVVACST